MSDAPKSAFELAMERLRKKDAEAGIQIVVKTLEEKVRGAWDRIGRVQARLPASLARAVFPADFAHGNEGVHPG